LYLSTDDTQTDNIGAFDMNTDLMNELTTDDAVMVPLSPTIFDFDSMPDSCADNLLALDETDNILSDLSSLEDFMDLTEFFVSSADLLLNSTCFLPPKHRRESALIQFIVGQISNSHGCIFALAYRSWKGWP